MSNLSITTRCNRSCSYCFAGDTRSDLARLPEMSREIFLKALDYLERSGISQVRLLGGEPTLHRDFSWMTRTALERGFQLLIFSNGRVSNRTLRHLASLDAGRVRILLNTVSPEEENSRDGAEQIRFMERLSARVTPGVNISSRNPRLHHLIEWIDRFGLRREIRLGISHPLLSRNNSYLHPKFYLEVGTRIVELKRAAEKADIRVGLDCGFVPCMFPVDSREEMAGTAVGTGQSCRPNLDLLPDGRFIACYPLHRMAQLPLNDGSDAASVMNHFQASRESFRNLGIFPACSSCPLFQSQCSGGCLAIRLLRLRGLQPVGSQHSCRAGSTDEQKEGRG